MKELTQEERYIILQKGTERPFSGKFYQHTEKGIYVCRQCGAPLYLSENKFHSGCGWPSFDKEISGAVTRSLDADGHRTEITCSRCGGHLGHVFFGEGFTPANTRHCVNSLSLDFVSDIQTAVFAGGCFWGVQHLMKDLDGILSIECGYTGGKTKNPSYEDVCTGETGHFEAVRIYFDPTKTSYETLAKLFFEIHDPTQANGQGPDIGQQYHSAVFYTNQEQKETVEKLIKILENKGYQIATQVLPLDVFWAAEEYHQHYYQKKGTQPYCHRRVERFD